MRRLVVRRGTARLLAASTAAAAAATVAAALVGCAAGASSGAMSAGPPPTPVVTTARGCPAAEPAPLPSSPGRTAVVIGPAQKPASPARPAHVNDAQTALREICAMMARSAARWTAGDLDAFMGDYMPGTGTTYIGRRGVVRGPEAIRAGYAPRFAPGGVHDSLSFEDVEVDLLAPDLTNTIAWYVLSRGDSTIARGPTSLVMRRVEGRWRIVHDHSS